MPVPHTHHFVPAPRMEHAGSADTTLPAAPRPSTPEGLPTMIALYEVLVLELPVLVGDGLRESLAEQGSPIPLKAC